ncbi:hypothetical protein Tco_0564077 [Tanacetum coccineum]
MFILKHPGNEYSLKDKNEAKTDKTEHGNGKSLKSQSQQVKVEAEDISILFGQPVPKLMGQDKELVVVMQGLGEQERWMARMKSFPFLSHNKHKFKTPVV